MTLLLTGGAGFIGCNFARRWLASARSAPLVLLDKFSASGSEENIADLRADPRVKVIHADVRDTEVVARALHENNVDVVVHMAAETHVDRSIARPLDFVGNNVVGTASVLEALRTSGLPARLHHVSTDEVFGSLAIGAEPVDEGAPYRPRSPYAATKASADHLIRAYEATYGLRATISFSSNNYGPFQHPEKLVPRTLFSALTGAAIRIYGDGANLRDWLFVADHCVALEQIVQSGRPGSAYCVGASEWMPNLALARLLCDRVDERLSASAALRNTFRESPAARGARSRELIEFVADRPGHDFRYAMTPAKLRGETGFHPAWTLQDALSFTVDWYIDHFDWLARRARYLAC